MKAEREARVRGVPAERAVTTSAEEAGTPVVPVTAPRSALRETFVRLERGVSAIRFLSVLLTIGFLWWAQTVLIPIVVSILVSYALEPAVARLKAWHCPRSIGVPIVMAGLIACVGGAAYGLRGQAVAFSSRLPEAAHKVAQAMSHRKSDAPGPVAKMQEAATELEKAAAANRPAKPADTIPSVRIEESTFRWSDWLWQGSHGVAEMAAQLVAVTCLVYYLLAAGDLYKRKLAHIVGPSLSEKRNAVEILAEIDRQVARFLWARVMISAAIGIAVWVGFLLLGLDDAGVWGVISGLVFAVPIVGPLLVIAAAAIAGFVQFGTLAMAGAAAGLTAVIAAIEGYVLTPLMMSRVGDMNAIAVFISLMFWGWLWGIWGLLLAVPITAALKAICERVDGLEAFAELLKE